MTPLFAADSMGKRFGSRTVLKSASIWGYPGRITVLLGRNGCGKSTLLKAGAGLIRADQGTVHFDGRAFLRPKLRELARLGMFYLPDRDLLSRRLTIGFQLRAIEWRFGTRGIPGTAQELGIAHLLDEKVPAVSGGERRRAELAAAIVRGPRCLLADEPFAGINPIDCEMVARAFRRLAKDGCAVILTGHEIDQVLEVADEVVWMSGGTTHSLGSTASALEHQQFRREYLGFGRKGAS